MKTTLIKYTAIQGRFFKVSGRMSVNVPDGLSVNQASAAIREKVASFLNTCDGIYCVTARNIVFETVSA